MDPLWQEKSVCYQLIDEVDTSKISGQNLVISKKHRVISLAILAVAERNGRFNPRLLQRKC